jgi:hypothetical protein
MRRYKSGAESQRAIAKSMGIDRTIVKKCLVRNNIENLPRHTSWAAEDKWRLVIICNSLNNDGQPVTGKEFMPFFPNHTYSSIKHNRDLLRKTKLIR